MIICVQWMSRDGCLSTPSDPDGKRDLDARLDVIGDRTDLLRIEIKCREEGDTSTDENNHRWTVCSMWLDIDKARQLRDTLNFIIKENT